MRVHYGIKSLILVLFLSACQTYQSVTVVPTTTNLSESFRLYFQSEDVVTVTGKVFEVKVFQHARVEVAANGETPAIRYYTYDLGIAPINARLPMQLKDVLVKPTGAAWDYFDGNQVYLFPAPEFQEDFVKSATFNTWNSIDQLQAYRYRLVYSNLSYPVQNERGMSTSTLDDGMAVIEVVIKCNGVVEMIYVDLRDHVLTFTDPSDPRIPEVWGVASLMAGKGVGSIFAPMGSLAR